MGIVGTVIVKDMSRFGRNYLEVGLYTEIRFPQMGVRFIAVNDGVDSDNQMDNDFTPFRNIINEWYAKDTSKKIRAVFRSKGMTGERYMGKAPYGYLMGENHQLIIDEETAPIVKQIFQLCVEGNGPRKIARILTEQGVPTPATILFQRTGQTAQYHPESPCLWVSGSVSGILKQDAYIGQTTNFKTARLSYKCKKQVENPPEKQVTVKGTHEAIIDEKTWELVQDARKKRQRPTRSGEIALFSGMLYCADCGKRMYANRTKAPAGQEYMHYVCGANRERKMCTAHYIRESVLTELVLQNLQRIAAYALIDSKDFVQSIIDEKMSEKKSEREKVKRKVEKIERRSKELDKIVQQLYEDKISGALTADRFSKLAAGYEAEQAELEQSKKELSAILSNADEATNNVESFMKTVRKFMEPTELTPTLLHELVDKIIVHETDKSTGQRIQQIDIHYKFIGEINLSPEYNKRPAPQRKRKPSKHR